MSWLDVLRLVGDRHYTLMHTPSISFIGLLLMSPLVFQFPWDPFYYPLPPPLSLGSANAGKGQVLKVEVQRRRRGQKGCRERKDKEQRARK